MALYQLTEADIHDVLELVSAQSLTITANNARRVAQLQNIFANAQPSKEVAALNDELRAAKDMADKCITARDHALLEAGLAKRELEDWKRAHPCSECEHGVTHQPPSIDIAN